MDLESYYYSKFKEYIDENKDYFFNLQETIRYLIAFLIKEKRDGILTDSYISLLFNTKTGFYSKYGNLTCENINDFYREVYDYIAQVYSTYYNFKGNYQKSILPYVRLIDNEFKDSLDIIIKANDHVTKEYKLSREDHMLFTTIILSVLTVLLSSKRLSELEGIINEITKDPLLYMDDITNNNLLSISILEGIRGIKETTDRIFNMIKSGNKGLL